MQAPQVVSKFELHTGPESGAFCVAQSGCAAGIVSPDRIDPWLFRHLWASPCCFYASGHFAPRDEQTSLKAVNFRGTCHAGENSE